MQHLRADDEAPGPTRAELPTAPSRLDHALTLAGIVSFMGMKVQGEPDIEFPGVIVSIAQPGAAAMVTAWPSVTWFVNW